ncbi:chaplin [Streptomyces sp. NPDC001348]
MRRVTRNGVIAIAAVSGAMAVTMPVCAAFAADGASADGSSADSPGLVSGNTVQVPVHVPVNVCGNTVNVVGLLNRAVGGTCANTGHTEGSGTAASGTAASGGASARGGGQDSEGALSGNGVQVPVDLPVNVSGNSVNGVGVGNSTEDNGSVNDPGDQSTQSANPTTPRTAAPRPTTQAKAHPGTTAPRSEASQGLSSLAHTGTDEIAPAAAASAALVVAGAVLYRRFRSGPVR